MLIILLNLRSFFESEWTIGRFKLILNPLPSLAHDRFAMNGGTQGDLNSPKYRAIVEVEKIPSRKEQYHDGLGSYG